MASTERQLTDDLVDGDPSARRSFPGGSVRLPRLRRPGAAAPTASATDTPRYGSSGPGHRTRDPRADRGFEAYFSTESLFDSSPVDPMEAEGPYAALGLTRAASWEEVSKAHRNLVAQLHPDRYVGAEDDVREAAEERVRVVNEAYATIRRQRAVRS